MNKKKIFNILMIIILISLIMFPKVCYATFDIVSELGGPLDSFKGLDTNSKKFDSMVNNVVYGLQTVGSIVSVIALVVLGIKYMCGSVEEKADYKKTMIPYVVGAIMVFAISTITGLIYNVAKNVI